MRQILLNLLDNAIKYTEQGFVKLSVCETNNGDLRFLVHDTGIGMEASDLLEILQPYVKLKKDKQGLGLGLSIVHKKVKQLGGKMEIISELHCGTKVMVTLPLEKKVPLRISKIQLLQLFC
ncbi:MAG: GHKL domain-containing protein [Saprospiraceae bacterium]|nr:GHKL domain-containing protein [Saprospiraceae bacterium]